MRPVARYDLWVCHLGEGEHPVVIVERDDAERVLIFPITSDTELEPKPSHRVVIEPTDED